MAGKAHAPGVLTLLNIDSTDNEEPKHRMTAATYDTAEKHVTNEYGLFKHTLATYYRQGRRNL
jgi:hypothetical protein